MNIDVKFINRILANGRQTYIRIITKVDLSRNMNLIFEYQSVQNVY